MLRLVIVLVAACGGEDDEAIPIEQIPGDTLLVELSDEEFRGVCDWGKDIAREKLPPGTSCEGSPVQFSGCMRVQGECTATVEQWQLCIPELLETIAADPCVVGEIGSMEELQEFIGAVPHCEGFGPCVTAMQ